MKDNPSTSDYGFIAFLTLVKSVKIQDSVKVRRGKMLYSFDLTEDEWLKYRLEYSQSIYPRFLQEIKLRQDPSF